MKKIAVLSFTDPFSGKKDGGKVEVLGRLKSLSCRDCEIDLYTKTKESIDNREVSKDLKIKNIYKSNQKNKLKYLFKALPISVNNKYSKTFKEVLKNNEYHLAIFEGEHMYKYAKNNDVNAKYKFLRMHDIESLYREELSKSSKNILKRYLQKKDSQKYKVIEENLINKFDKLLFISKSELLQFEKMYPQGKDKYFWLPPAVHYKNEINYSKAEEDKILYFGDLTVSNNIYGIEWYLHKVHKNILHKNNKATIDIIGNISDELKSKYNKIQGVTAHGYVDDLNGYIDRATMIISPILHGAGVKIKLVEAIGLGKIVVATSKAVEGTDFTHKEHLLISDDKDTFGNYCLDIMNNKEKYYYLCENGIKNIKENYSFESQGEKIFTLLKG